MIVYLLLAVKFDFSVADNNLRLKLFPTFEFNRMDRRSLQSVWFDDADVNITYFVIHNIILIVKSE